MTLQTETRIWGNRPEREVGNQALAGNGQCYDCDRRAKVNRMTLRSGRSVWHSAPEARFQCLVGFIILEACMQAVECHSVSQDRAFKS